MAGLFNTVKPARLKIPELGELQRVRISVPSAAMVPFAMVELDGNGNARQTLRLDLDKRRFLDIPDRQDYAAASQSIAEYIVDFLQCRPAPKRVLTHKIKGGMNLKSAVAIAKNKSGNTLRARKKVA